MKNSNYSKAKVLTLIPIIVLTITVICIVLALKLEVPADRDVLYTILAFTSLISLTVAPFLCLVISIIGTVFAAKAIKEGTSKASIFLILGIIEILVSILGTFLAIIMFIVGQGV